ncbi:sensor domain-containing diguanylate cyclase [Candidatus Nitrotoga sp. 1052]|uniref:sensor domain-containing diguanylate cyclase n=1 Tax=Candidatus Nitrotoga sp. 1052 TaxID=2886964 RepID=UPI001EF4338E|nr:GGDEF domain-containing protein [Candidatus Nitrotoga sp. 1052]CAH1092258.1 GGDEF family protein [Candidatus Nitrotoga sp. 1052]
MKKITPIELARQALIQLSNDKSPPTPDNYRRAYNKIAGIEFVDHSAILNKSLEKVLYEMGKEHPKLALVAESIHKLVEKSDQTELEELLRSLLSTGTGEAVGVNWTTLLRSLLKQLEINHGNLSLSKKIEKLNHILIKFANDPNQLGQKMHILITSWGKGPITHQSAEISHFNAKEAIQEQSTIQTVVLSSNPIPHTDDSQWELAIIWRDMLIRTINLAVAPQLADTSGATQRIEALLKRMRESLTIAEVNVLSETLKSTLLRAELKNDSQRRMQALLVQMLRLLVSSMGEMTIEDEWLHRQITIVQEIISKPINIDLLYNAENSLKELIYKQSHIKPGLIEAKEAIKRMAATFVSNLADITESTGNYQFKINNYQEQITSAHDMTNLNAILENLVVDIRKMSVDAQRNLTAFQETQKKVEEAEKQINDLTTKLDYISEAAHQDFLTGALNRRGMDAALAQEFERADRHETPLTLAMMDIDHFKKINDSLGHSTGDVALAHLVKVVKSIIRSTDVLARYGGEEFIIILPGTKENDAIDVIKGVQRDLTKNFFLHNNERVLITFSAGVAERFSNETVDEVLPRADAALYKAKQTGRNQVIGASEPKQ